MVVIVLQYVCFNWRCGSAYMSLFCYFIMGTIWTREDYAVSCVIYMNIIVAQKSNYEINFVTLWQHAIAVSTQCGFFYVLLVVFVHCVQCLLQVFLYVCHFTVYP